MRIPAEKRKQKKEKKKNFWGDTGVVCGDRGDVTSGAMEHVECLAPLGRR